MDAETFARIYDSHYPRVFRYLLARIRGQQEAEELAAEVFAAALEGLERGREPRHIGNWLVGIADHLASRFWRKRATERDLVEADGATDSRDPEDLAMRQLETEALWRCLGALEPEHRQVLLLRIVAELPAKQVGLTMGRSEEAVRSLQLRALRALRRHWTEANGNEGLRHDARHRDATRSPETAPGRGSERRLAFDASGRVEPATADAGSP